MEKNVTLSETTRDDKGVLWKHPGGKFRRLGPDSCTESELLAIILGSGINLPAAETAGY